MSNGHTTIFLEIRPRGVDDGYVVFLVTCVASESVSGVVDEEEEEEEEEEEKEKEGDLRLSWLL